MVSYSVHDPRRNNRKIEASFNIEGIVELERNSSIIKISRTKTIYFRTPKAIVEMLKKSGLDLQKGKNANVILNCYLVSDSVGKYPAIIFEFDEVKK